MSAKIGMIGAGSWATAIVKLLNTNQHKVNWWVRNADVLDSLQNENFNCRYLSSVQFNSSLISPTNNLEKTIAESDVLVVAVPSAFLKNVFGT